MILSLGFSSRGFWVRYFMQSWFPLVPKPQSPGLCHIYLLCPLLVPVGKWWPQCIPEPSPSSTSCNAPSLPPVLLERMQCMYQGTQCTHWLQPFWVSSRGGATNYFLRAAKVRHFCSGNICSFHLETFSRCLSWVSRGHRLISFQIDWFELRVVQGTLRSLFQHHNSKASAH